MTPSQMREGPDGQLAALNTVFENHTTEMEKNIMSNMERLNVPLSVRWMFKHSIAIRAGYNQIPHSANVPLAADNFYDAWVKLLDAIQSWDTVEVEEDQDRSATIAQYYPFSMGFDEELLNVGVWVDHLKRRCI